MSNITLHPTQSEVYSSLFLEKLSRFAIVCASRGWGKSHIAAVTSISASWELMKMSAKVPNKVVCIIAPTYSQVTDIYYPLLMYQLGLERYAIKSSKDLGRIWLPNSVEIKLVSFEAIERLRGTGIYFAVLDEVCSWTKGLGLKEAWQSIIQPCIVTRWSPRRARTYKAPSPGRALVISTPKGYNDFYDMYNFQDSDNNFKSFHYNYKSSPLLDPDEIERIRHTIDPLKFNREYLASFEESGNNVFYCFDRKKHVDKNIPSFDMGDSSRKGEDVHAFIDFNVGIQATSLWALRGNQLFAIDEIKGHPDTESLAITLKNRFPNNKIYGYPDPTGKARKTSAAVGITDFSILQQNGINIRARDRSPNIVDSVNCVNRMFETAAGEINAYVHPRCTGLITSFERTVWLDNNPNTATIDKKEGIEHFSDGARYGFEYLFPIRLGNKTTARGFGF